MTNEPRHLRRMTNIWVIASVVVDVLFWFLVGPHMAPGRLTSTAGADQTDINILMVIALPVLLAVWVFLGYSIRVWSSKKNGPESVGGPAAAGHKGVITAWIVTTTVIVLGLAIFGTIALIADHGSGGGEGPNPIWAPAGATAAETAALTKDDSWSPSSGKVLVVQVIAQQWKFTYRYPQFGGFETTQLMLPADTSIAFNVTSLDVIHSFWAYQLGVKADANPQQNNVAFTDTKGPGDFTVRCSELCGLWHGAMYDFGKVVSASDFESWATSTESANATNTSYLAPFAWTYVPDANGAAGGYYIDANVTPYSKSELYGAKQ
ncbi:MAG: cytochrome c oxidase subunit II [Acidimicrobiales bacterium]